MITIWKFPLISASETILEVPMGARFLAVQVQDDVPCLWALVNSDNRRIAFSVKVIGTGHEADIEGYQYIGTFQLGRFVGHTFVKGVDNA